MQSCSCIYSIMDYESWGAVDVVEPFDFPAATAKHIKPSSGIAAAIIWAYGNRSCVPPGKPAMDIDYIIYS